MTAPCEPGIAEKHAGAEPLPGYRLLRPLGRGGFGEVWKCEAPGGLPKAIKFVPAGGEQSRQEQEAVEQIKSIRHPFLLTLERVELVGGELVMVMELADCQLNDRFRRYRADGHPGIPRDELLGYLREAAEALDLIGTRFGLQHLDVKPENLFLVAGHLKVGDYGLVRRTHRADAGDDSGRGFTPRYTAPEVLRGRVDPRSDQYSLALVYAELLTATFPYPGQTAQQLMLQHIGTPPDLSDLAPADRLVVGRALAKDPADRFPSCTAFVRALAGGPGGPSAPPGVAAAGPAPATRADRAPTPPQGETPTLPNRPLAVPPTQERPPEPAVPPATPAVVAPPPPREPGSGPGPGRAAARRAKEPAPANPFAGLRSVMWVDQLARRPGAAAAPPDLTPQEYVAAVVRAVVGGGPDADPAATACRFLSTLPATMVPLKLALVAENWGMTVEPRGPGRIVLRREAPKRLGKSDPRPGPPAAFEVIVHRPAPPLAEYTATGAVDGPPTDPFTLQALADLPQILAAVRGQLQNLDERRNHPRYAGGPAARVHPLYEDGVVGPPVAAECVDVSAGGVRFRTRDEVRTGRLYAEFPDLGAVAGRAIYVRVVRTGREPGGGTHFVAGRFPAGQ